jgi:hypothetical protein
MPTGTIATSGFDLETAEVLVLAYGDAVKKFRTPDGFIGDEFVAIARCLACSIIADAKNGERDRRMLAIAAVNFESKEENNLRFF